MLYTDVEKTRGFSYDFLWFWLVFPAIDISVFQAVLPNGRYTVPFEWNSRSIQKKLLVIRGDVTKYFYLNILILFFCRIMMWDTKFVVLLLFSVVIVDAMVSSISFYWIIYGHREQCVNRIVYHFKYFILKNSSWTAVSLFMVEYFYCVAVVVFKKLNFILFRLVMVTI